MYPQLILKSGRERSIINRHPWVFSGAVKQMPQASKGSIVAICNNQEQVIAHGFFDANSQIVCKLFDFGVYQTAYDAQFWINRIVSAYQLRHQILNLNRTNTYRLLHAEGDFLPGIIADVYNQIVVIQILTKGTELILPYLLAGLQTVGFEHIYLKNKEQAKQIEGVSLKNGWLIGGIPEMVRVMENGLLYDVDIENGQKTGFFIDQRDNRQLLSTLVAGKKVLNTFAYTGGFSVAALAGGASKVVSIDISKDAIKQCLANVEINQQNHSWQHDAIAVDAFKHLRSLNESFDVIVLDPPAFAKNAKSVPNAARGYKDLNLIALKNIAPGGLLFTYSCSQNITPDLFRKIVFGAAADAQRDVRILKLLGQGPDHPINIFHPEGEYLKGLLLQIQ